MGQTSQRLVAWDEGNEDGQHRKIDFGGRTKICPNTRSLVYKDLTYKDQETPSTENFLKNKRFPGSPVLKISGIRDFLVHLWTHRWGSLQRGVVNFALFSKQ